MFSLGCQCLRLEPPPPAPKSQSEWQAGGIAARLPFGLTNHTSKAVTAEATSSSRLLGPFANQLLETLDVCPDDVQARRPELS